MCAGELAVVAKEDMTPYLEHLIPMIIDNIQDQVRDRTHIPAWRPSYTCCTASSLV